MQIPLTSPILTQNLNKYLSDIVEARRPGIKVPEPYVVPDRATADAISFSPAAEQYLKGFREELTKAREHMSDASDMRINEPPEPEKPDKFNEIFRVFSETADAGQMTEKLSLYWEGAEHASKFIGLSDPILSTTDFFPEVTRAYETEYMKLQARLESGEIDEKTHAKSLKAIDNLFDDFVRQANMEPLFMAGGLEHPMVLMPDLYNPDYKRMFLNARDYIKENGSLEGVTEKYLNRGTQHIGFGTVQALYSPEGKRAMADTIMVIHGETGGFRQLNKKKKENPEMTDEEYDRILADLRRQMREQAERLKADLRSTIKDEALRFILTTSLDWASFNYFSDKPKLTSEHVEFSDFYNQARIRAGNG